MVGKKEQLKLTKKRLQTLNERIGKNIIKSFQTTYLNVVEDPEKDLNLNHMSEEEQIEEILEEANAYNLRQEVKDSAEKSLKESSLKGVWLSRIDAYVNAYYNWIK